MRTKQILPALAFVFLVPIYLMAASSASTHKLEWLPPYEKKFSAESSFRSLNFTGATFDENYMPVFVWTESLPSSTAEAIAELKNVVTEPMTDVDLIRNPTSIGADFKVTTQVVVKKKRYFASVTILPVRRNSTGGFERLVSFDVEVKTVRTVSRAGVARIRSTNSVLANGDWYRIAVLQTGVYKIDYNFLKSITGFDVDSINPKYIHLYGNGGGMLPYANNKFRYDDLHLNRIFISGESDNHFDPNDYILFFGTNQTTGDYDPATGLFSHQVNYYADTTYYFLTVGLSSDTDRVVIQPTTPSPNNTVTSYDELAYHEADLVNFLKSGREWYGESMDNLNNTISSSNTFPNLITNDSVYLLSKVAGRSTGAGINSMSLSLNGTSLGSQNFSAVGTSVQDNYVSLFSINRNFIPNSNTINLTFSLNSGDPNSQGWLNSYDLRFRCNLTAANMGSQFGFTDTRSVGPGNISEFRISNTSNGFTVWDVTKPLNPIQEETSVGGGVTSFTIPNDLVHTFIAFNGQQFYSPSYTGKIENQNLHSLAQAKMIIVTSPLFLQQAYELADFHRTHDNLSVIVATTSQIFNEFSSGAQDVSAIRDFVKMFYDRAGTDSTLLPKYLLLFGDASYDNKYRLSGNTNFVTSYQSAGSINLTQSYISDDFFGLLDDNEGEWTSGEIVDLAVGRLPVKSASEAQAAVNKIKHYVAGGSGGTNPTFGNWRNIVSFVADDQDQNTHLRQTDTLAMRVRNAYPLYNIDKIYMDAYNQLSTPGGQRYPDAHQAIVDRVERGNLLITYIGHGGELGWAHERVLEVSDIEGWSNFDRLAAFLTATCEFTRVDDPSRNSAGELVFLNPNGGGICLFTTSRLAFSSSNFNLCQKFFTHIFDKSSGTYPTTGEIFEQTKVDYFADPYVRNFLLIGDPAVRLAYPNYKVTTNTVNGINITAPIDTLKALSKITITGQVDDNSGNKLTNFNGTIYPTVFDKMVTYSTLGNDRFDPDASTAQPFLLQKNVIYGGKASVINGDFTFTFVVPKDIAFQFGKGKLSYYAHNGYDDATGYDTTIVVGGVSGNLNLDGDGPKIQLYLNDEKFVRGGMTDKNPYLYAIVRDSSGINTVGTGIGHDMTAELDAKTEKRYILNDFYETDLDSYQSGKVKYPFKNLESGSHTVTFKVWDVYNNSSEATTDFVVSESAELALDHVLNYPNPFTTHTTFMFEHNRPNVPMDVQVQIFTVSGKLIKTISDKIITEGFRSDKLQWDGLDDFGDRIGKGVYVYRLRINTIDGQYADKFEKLVILR